MAKIVYRTASARHIDTYKTKPICSIGWAGHHVIGSKFLKVEFKEGNFIDYSSNTPTMASGL